MKKIKAACEGDHEAFDHVLDLVYGRKGKVRWEIMKARAPLLTDPSAPRPTPIIPSVPKSRPPVYSPVLSALLTAGYSRTTKALRQNYLKFPPTLSPRADPSSEEAQMLGPLSKRREVNTRWRWFTQEWKKVYPPLEVVVRDPSSGTESTERDAVSQANIREVGLQGHHLFEEIEQLVGQSHSARTPTRRERQTLKENGETRPQELAQRPTRWLRRRYQRLLARLPALIYTPGRNSSPGRYSVELSALSVAHDLRGSTIRKPELDADNLAWYELSQKKSAGRAPPQNEKIP
ncbi:hypothetical protein V5O48_001193 [Marasmius crinis-equi]|uniref:Uncharacterized protein n=1 Tax=Marasmius crinis-equi TaxID=585013 RepID=A0ABR3FZH3_9AGAR